MSIMPLVIAVSLVVVGPPSAEQPGESDDAGLVLTARIQNALSKSALDGFNGEVEFVKEMRLPPAEGVRAGVEVVEQRWHIVVADGGKWLRGRIEPLESGQVGEFEQVLFGETSGTIWWALGKNLYVYHKDALGELRKSENKRGVVSAEQFVTQARSELRTILAGADLRGADSEITVTAAGLFGGRATANVVRGGVNYELALESRGLEWNIVSVTKTLGQVKLHWTFGDYQAAGLRNVPGWIDYRSDNPDRGGDHFLYKAIVVTECTDSGDAYHMLAAPRRKTADLGSGSDTRIDYTVNGISAIQLIP